MSRVPGLRYRVFALGELSYKSESASEVETWDLIPDDSDLTPEP